MPPMCDPQSARGGGNPAAPARGSSASSATDRRRRSASASTSSPVAAKLRRTIFALCRERGIDTDLRHDLQESVTGHRSLTDCTVADMRMIVARLSGQNVWTPSGMMLKLAAEVENGLTRLRAFCWERFASVPEDLDENQVRGAISFLKNIRKKERISS